MEEWRKPIKKTNYGEAGVVYYLNASREFKEFHLEWTMASPFTLNPLHGKTIEQMLKKSTAMPGFIKDNLLKRREAESLLSDGSIIKYWISEKPAPENWGTFPEEEKSKLII